MQSYFFVLGRENKISQKEIESVLANFDFYFPATRGVKYSISILNQEVLEIKFSREADSEIIKLIGILGGTVKIFKKIVNSSKDNLLPECLKIIKNSQGRVIFGISNYCRCRSGPDIFRLGLEIKKKLKESGKFSRYIDGKGLGRLSSAQSFHYKFDRQGIEIGVFASGIGKLIAVQNIDDWSHRDYGKPRSDARSGMLPPKLARMMINLALGQIERSKIKNQRSKLIVVDPFCGSGNILIEALILGCSVNGSDISEKAMADTKENLNWAAKNLNLRRDYRVLKADATKFDFGAIHGNFLVVTEPYLGRPRRYKLTIGEKKEVASEASKLYLDFLQNAVYYNITFHLNQ